MSDFLKFCLSFVRINNTLFIRESRIMDENNELENNSWWDLIGSPIRLRGYLKKEKKKASPKFKNRQQSLSLLRFKSLSQGSPFNPKPETCSTPVKTKYLTVEEQESFEEIFNDKGFCSQPNPIRPNTQEEPSSSSRMSMPRLTKFGKESRKSPRSSSRISVPTLVVSDRSSSSEDISPEKDEPQSPQTASPKFRFLLNDSSVQRKRCSSLQPATPQKIVVIERKAKTPKSRKSNFNGLCDSEPKSAFRNSSIYSRRRKRLNSLQFATPKKAEIPKRNAITPEKDICLEQPINEIVYDIKQESPLILTPEHFTQDDEPVVLRSMELSPVSMEHYLYVEEINKIENNSFHSPKPVIDDDEVELLKNLDCFPTTPKNHFQSRDDNFSNKSKFVNASGKKHVSSENISDSFIYHQIDNDIREMILEAVAKKSDNLEDCSINQKVSFGNPQKKNVDINKKAIDEYEKNTKKIVKKTAQRKMRFKLKKKSRKLYNKVKAESSLSNESNMADQTVEDNSKKQEGQSPLKSILIQRGIQKINISPKKVQFSPAPDIIHEIPPRSPVLVVRVKNLTKKEILSLISKPHTEEHYPTDQDESSSDIDDNQDSPILRSPIFDVSRPQGETNESVVFESPNPQETVKAHNNFEEFGRLQVRTNSEESEIFESPKSKISEETAKTHNSFEECGRIEVRINSEESEIFESPKSQKNKITECERHTTISEVSELFESPKSSKKIMPSKIIETPKSTKDTENIKKKNKDKRVFESLKSTNSEKQLENLKNKSRVNLKSKFEECKEAFKDEMKSKKTEKSKNSKANLKSKPEGKATKSKAKSTKMEAETLKRPKNSRIPRAMKQEKEGSPVFETQEKPKQHVPSSSEVSKTLESGKSIASFYHNNDNKKMINVFKKDNQHFITDGNTMFEMTVNKSKMTLTRTSEVTESLNMNLSVDKVIDLFYLLGNIATAFCKLEGYESSLENIVNNVSEINIQHNSIPISGKNENFLKSLDDLYIEFVTGRFDSVRFKRMPWDKILFMKLYPNGFKKNSRANYLLIYYVLYGEVTFTVNNIEGKMQKGSTVNINANDRYSFKNTTSDNCILKLMRFE